MENTALNVLLCAAASALATQAAAQSAPAEPPPAAVEEVIVTATRREQALQDVPVAITALSGATLQASGVTKTEDLTQVAPGLTFSRLNAVFQPQIRGVGSRGGGPGDESTVAIYVDGVYQPEASSASFDLLKVTRVEVLRGPQGTLFGRNATGGLINVITPDPRFEPGAEAALRLGGDGEKSIKTYVTGALSRTVAADLALLAYDDDGYIKDLVRGGKTGDRTSYAIRSKILWRPSDAARAVLTVNYASSDDAAAVSFNPINGNTRGRALSPSVVLPKGPYETALTFTPYTKLTQYGAALNAAYELPSVSLQSTTSYQYNRLSTLTDGDASPINLTLANPLVKTSSVAEEIRVLSTGSERLTWIAGAYGFVEHAAFDPSTNITYTYPAGVGTAQTLVTRNQTRSLAAFAEGAYDITDAFSATVGLRYTYEDRHYRSRINGVGRVDDSVVYREVTPRVILKYEVSPDLNLYGSFSQGFKSGIYNSSGTAPDPVRPEKVDAYELGLKTDPLPWLRANFALFRYDYTDLQIQVRQVNVNLLQNAAAAEIWGGEAEITAAVSSHLTLRLAAAHLDATYKSFPNALVTVPIAAGGNNQAPADATGKDLSRAPSWTLNLGAEYKRPLGAGVLEISGNAFFSDEYYWDPMNRIAQPEYSRINGQIAWALPDKGWRFSLWGQNLTDEVIIANVNTQANADYATYQAPRRIGVAIEKVF